MAEIRLTENQKRAVYTRGSSVLVSAAAGSGKTKVLVERLMAYMTDPENPRDVNTFLIITYTRAAAAQLRDRIIEGINERAAAEPSNRRLRRQTALCYQAKIGTIHSFCTTVLRENCHLAALAPDFRVIEEERAQQIKESVLDRLLEKRYESIGTDGDFRLLADTVGAGRDDSRLSALVLELHGKMLSNAWPERWVRGQEEALFAHGVSDIAQTIWGRVLTDDALEKSEYWTARMGECVSALADAPEKIKNAYLDSFAHSHEDLCRLSRALRLGWDEARKALPVEFPRLGSLRGSPDPELSDRVKSVREMCRKAMEKLTADFSDSSECLLDEMRQTAPAMRALLRLVLRFDELYSQEKRRRGFVDFSDLEHIALGLLYDAEKDAPTELAREISSRFTEIMVDEYQDVNEVQELIFRCISRGEKNLFMVGDVKQSIYRFRLADPTIFLEKYRSFAPDEEAEQGASRRILLRENFRSRRCILQGANHIFKNIMSRRLGELDYDGDAALRHGAEYYDEEHETPVSFEILTSPPQDEEDSPDRITLEARHVAARIKQLVESGAPVTDSGSMRAAGYGDCVILLRSPGSAGRIYRRALAEAGVPVVSEQGGGFFTSVEVSVAVSLLAVIDDPHQDVALISVLRSPVFGFSSDDLAAIRACDRAKDFYSALCLHAEISEKSKAFLDTLARFRALAPDLSASELLRCVYTDLDMPALCSAMSDGAARRANLMLLLDYARRFEENGYRGLFRFVAWLEKLAERGDEPSVGGESVSAVRIMSIHKSKGLEFPFVFIPDTARRFNMSDTTASVLVHSKLGLGPKFTDLDRRVEYPTAARRAISAQLRRETLSEEMRVLYVGATRAQEKLFFSCVWKDPQKKLEKIRQESSSPVSPLVLEGCGSFSEWLAHCAVQPDSPVQLFVVQPQRAENTAGIQKKQSEQAINEQIISEIESRLKFEYPWKAASELPSKLTATEMKGRSEVESEAYELVISAQNSFRMPDFARREKPLTAVQRGVAHHLVLQHMDFSASDSPESIALEVERLEKHGFITPEQAKAVDPAAVYGFFVSPIGRRVLTAESVRREFKFSLMCPAEEFYDNAEGEKLLLQGVVDCCIEEQGEITIIDYKTDYVNKNTIQARADYYRGQLRAYAAAMQRITGMPVRETVLYFLSCGDTVTFKYERDKYERENGI